MKCIWLQPHLTSTCPRTTGQLLDHTHLTQHQVSLSVNQTLTLLLNFSVMSFCLLPDTTSLCCIQFQPWEPARFLWVWLPSLSPHHQGTCLASSLWGEEVLTVGSPWPGSVISQLVFVLLRPLPSCLTGSKPCTLFEPQFPHQKNDILIPQSCSTD